MKAPGRQTLLTEPKALTIVCQKLDRRGLTIAEHKDRARERISCKRLTASATQPINPRAEIDRFDGNQDACLCGDLDHDGRRLQNACTTLLKSTVLTLSMRMRSPSQPYSSMLIAWLPFAGICSDTNCVKAVVC